MASSEMYTLYHMLESQVYHQMKLQAALQALVDEMEIVITPPDASWLRRNKLIVAHALRRGIDVASG